MLTTDKIKTLPSEPGVYMMKDKEGNIIYVGKAKDLRKRLKSYLSGRVEQRYTIKYLISKVEDIKYIITCTEKEALILENTLIKKYKPRYNINLKDDKTYISLRIGTTDDFPRITIVRRVRKDGARYLGPYTSASSVRETLKAMYRIFPLRTCSDAGFKRRTRPCINFGMKRCLAPCVGLVEKDIYMELVKGATLFLVGKNIDLLNTLRRRMKELSDRLCFEEAAMVRDQVRAIETTLEKQKMFFHISFDQDVIGVYNEGKELVIQLLFVREGRVTGVRDFYFLRYEMPLEEILSSFLIQYYRGGSFIPQRILMPVHLEDSDTIEKWLRQRCDRKVNLTVPEAGDSLKLLQMAERNAQEAMKRMRESRRIQEDITENLMKLLSLKKRPGRIEAFDISNLQGGEAVGSLILFQDGFPVKKWYRLFRIKSVEGIDDYGMMREVLTRRYAGPGLKKMPTPDLIMIDGGKGHLHTAMEVLKALEITNVEIMAIAKARDGEAVDKMFLPDRTCPLLLERDSPSYLLLQRIRDEAHRFAIGYHKKLRARKITSVLKDIPGVGKKKSTRLLTCFGSLKNIKKASLEDICKVKGVNRKVAEAIYKTFHTIP
ncbi:MAG: excinuclease ABC subunit UvrC [Thermodesulfobacteriota bacterium]